MSLRAVGRGVVAGLVLAALLALGLAVTLDRTPLPTSTLAVGLWVGRMLVSTGAGWFAGRRRESGAGLNGTFSGLTVAILGSVVGAQTGLSMGSVGLGLAGGAFFGAVGGLVAAME